jgi:lipid A 3-O-deacylase
MSSNNKRQGMKFHSAYMLIWFAILIPLFIVYSGNAQDFLSAGVRGGMSYNSNGHSFRQAETFVDLDLPWAWNFYSDWRFQPKVDVSGGWLGGENTDGFVGSLGPTVELSKGRFPLTLEGGSSPTFLSKYRFRDEYFGDNVQFTSHIGLNWRLTKHISIGYRFQHMSNAGLGSPNPGLNMNMFSFTYHF